jgi:twitching motility protein PilT
LIRENKVPQITSMMQMGQRYGMQTIEDSVKSLVQRGLVNSDELERFVPPGQEQKPGAATHNPPPVAAAQPAALHTTAPPPEERRPAPPPSQSIPEAPKKGVSSLFR